MFSKWYIQLLPYFPRSRYGRWIHKFDLAQISMLDALYDTTLPFMQTFGLLKHNMRLLMELNQGAFTCKVNVLMEWGQLEIGLANERGKNERETFLTCHLMETAI